MELLSNGGRETGTVMSSTRTQPWASSRLQLDGFEGADGGEDVLQVFVHRPQVVLAGGVGARRCSSWLHLLGDVTAEPGPELRSQVFTFARES
ncbi:hypothetical protein SGLAM104S_04413 [Streptomyces glaucescens]